MNKFTVSEIKDGKVVTTVHDMSPEMERLTAEMKQFADEQVQLSAGCKNHHIVYYPDGTHPACSKHCWACPVCGSIEQVG